MLIKKFKTLFSVMIKLSFEKGYSSQRITFFTLKTLLSYQSNTKADLSTEISIIQKLKHKKMCQLTNSFPRCYCWHGAGD